MRSNVIDVEVVAGAHSSPERLVARGGLVQTVFAIYTLMAILGAMAILIVQAVCSFAVLNYSRTRHPETRHWFRTFVAPLLGGPAMPGAVLLVVNMGNAAGTEAHSVILKATPYLVGAVALLGLGYTTYLDRYALLGRTVLEETHER